MVPAKGRQRAMEMLHEAHPGAARMKALARGYLWWPGLDKAVEKCARECSVCQSSRKEQPVVPIHTCGRTSRGLMSMWITLLRWKAKCF